MVLIFDLDDTLFDEMTYVRSGLRAVAAYGQESFGLDKEVSFSFMDSYLLMHGRGKVFDEWLRVHGYYSSARVTKCVHVYRHHRPTISILDAAKKTLSQYQGACPLYLVTDGHKVVQQNKIDALGIESFFKRCFVTHRFGIRHSKPSLYCFEKIRNEERCSWSSMVYVGDNPAKDFVNLNAIGAVTVRVKTGVHALDKAKLGFDALYSIHDLSHLPCVLDQVIDHGEESLYKLSPSLNGDVH